MGSVRVLCALVLAFSATLARAAMAQSPPVADDEPATRAELLRREREKKQEHLSPNEPDALQRVLDYVETRGVYLVSRSGFYPKIGSLTTGSGLALGLGFRNRTLLDRRGVVEVWGAGSFRKYWALQGRVALPELAGGRLAVEAIADLREYPRESFFGLGPESRRSDLTRFSLRSRELAALGAVRLAPALMIGGGIGSFVPESGGEQLDYVRSRAFVDVDYREPLNARQGGWYRIDLSRFADRRGGARSFTRLDVDLRQYVGFLADRRVIALRGFLSTSEPAGGSTGIPFYLMPALGGNDTLRGFRDYRFRGSHALLLQAEYRWEIWSGLDAALFYDAGKVALRRSDLDFKRLEDDFGFGFRFNTSQGVIMRVDAAFGSRDGKHLHIVFGGVF